MKLPFLSNSPIRKNILANLFGVGVQLMNQIILVPFYILYWGNDLYSDWIVISALTTIFSMSDVGLNNVIQNRFAVQFNEGNYHECRSLLTDNYVLIIITMTLTLLGVVGFALLGDLPQAMNLHSLSHFEASWIFVLLVAKVFVGMLSCVQDAVYRATHNASTATYFSQLGLLATALITLLCIVLHVSVIALCIAITLPQLFLIFFKSVHSQKYFSYHFSYRSFDLKLLKGILLPSLTFMSFPIGNAIVLQGFTLVVNRFFGADSVVLYNTTRTLCNFIKTFLGTLQTAVWPEYSIAYGQKDYDMMRHLHRRILKITFFVSLLIGLILVVLGPYIYQIWTNGKIEFQYSLMIAYVFVLFFESLWTSSSVTLMATNNHSKLGVIYIIAAGFSLALAFVLGNNHASLWAIAASLIVMHILVGIYALPAGFKLTRDSIFKRI